MVEALDAIWQEALAHGMRPGGPPPILFEDPAQQHEYENLRDRGLASWQELYEEGTGRKIRREMGKYPESERLLGELAKVVQAYLDLSLPRLRELLI